MIFNSKWRYFIALLLSSLSKTSAMRISVEKDEIFVGTVLPYTINHIQSKCNWSTIFSHYRAVKLWNSLDQNIKEAKSLSITEKQSFRDRSYL